MKKIRIKRYDLGNRINKKIALISDLHYYQNMDINRINRLLGPLKNINPDYICIPGDILDESYVLDEDIIICFLNKLASIAKVIISYGNHDTFCFKENKTKENKELYSKIKSIRNICLLDNSIYTDNNISFIGFNIGSDYFYIHGEDKNIFIKEFNKTIPKLNNNYNVLLCHSPIDITDEYVYNKLKVNNKLDLVLCGHMHGGLTFDFLKPFLKTRGFISPDKRKIFIKNSYGNIKISNTDFIITSGITTFSHASNLMFMNMFYHAEIALISI